MKKLLQLEEVAMWGLGLFLLFKLDAPWWIYLLSFIGPDIGMVGYGVGDRVGAITYNLLHHKAVALAIFGLGVVFEFKYPWVMWLGALLFSHASMDRIFGYGLKTHQGFHFTHLGKIGRNGD